MSGFRRYVLAILLLGCAAPASAQIDSLTVSLLPGAVGFTLTPGSSSNPGTLAIAVTTTWTLLLPTRTSVTVYGYFSSAAAALAHSSPTNTTDIPSSRVEASINGGAQLPFSQSVVFGAASGGRVLVTQPIGIFNLSGTRTDALTLNINLNGYAMPADTYVGVLRIRAQATP